MSIEPVGLFFDTFNPVTIGSAIISGFLFGLLAFVPLIRRIAGEGPPPPTARQAFWGTFGIIGLSLGAVVTVFYVEQIATEIALNSVVYFRAIGRFATFLVFDVAFALGVATTVWREYHRRNHRAQEGPDGPTG